MRRRHRQAEHAAEQQEQHAVRVRGGRERGFAEEVPHPERIHGRVQGLQHVAVENRQREEQEPATDGPLCEGEVAASTSAATPSSSQPTPSAATSCAQPGHAGSARR